ncbi:MAG: peptidoglycan-binding domain-containing protein [Deltaproteobacteria bacterium]
MKNIMLFAVCALAVLVVSGCATYDPARLDDMEYRLSRLEKKVLPTPEATGAPEKTVVNAAPQPVEEETAAPAVAIPDSPTKKDIQQALKNAGYYDGEVDGKFGPKTKSAIEAFQDANNLIADGKPGVNTWEKLRAFYTPTSEE